MVTVWEIRNSLKLNDKKKKKTLHIDKRGTQLTRDTEKLQL